MKSAKWSIPILFILFLVTCEPLDRLSRTLEYLAEQEDITNTCETQQNSIHVNKEEYDEIGNIIRYCSGDVTVNKCEGTCASQVEPSVVMPTGFMKFCQCCREMWMTQKDTRLTDCYDSNGQRIFGELGTMTILLKEPENCSCHTCG